MGKCTTCRFNGGFNCTIGSYYAEKGEIRNCIEGESWEANFVTRYNGCIICGGTGSYTVGGSFGGPAFSYKCNCKKDKK